MAAVSTQIDNRIDFDRFQRLIRAVRVMAWVLRFVKNARCPQRRESSPDLSSTDIETCRIMVLKRVQNEFYNEEISDLKDDKCVRKTSSIYQLLPFIGEDGLIRVYGRLKKAPALLYDEKHPHFTANVSHYLPACEGSTRTDEACGSEHTNCSSKRQVLDSVNKNNSKKDLQSVHRLSKTRQQTMSTNCISTPRRQDQENSPLFDLWS